jgi:hypothetical protein
MTLGANAMTIQKIVPQRMIEQTYVGQISVVGECFCFGAALDGGVPAQSGGGQQLVYLDLAGPATSVEAVWAKLAQAKECYVIPPGHDAEKITLRSAEGKLKRLERKVEGIGIYHLLLVHCDIFEPQYAELSTTYIFLTTDKDQTTSKLGAHVQELVDIAVFPVWFPYLVQQGRVEGLITALTCYGGVKLWKLSLDKSAWERVVCRGLQQRVIRLP